MRVKQDRVQLTSRMPRSFPTQAADGTTTSPKKRAARRQRVTEAVVNGTSMTEMVRAEGVSRSWISREANSEVRHRIAEAIDARADRLAGLIDEAFDDVHRPALWRPEQRQLE